VGGISSPFSLRKKTPAEKSAVRLEYWVRGFLLGLSLLKKDPDHLFLIAPLQIHRAQMGTSVTAVYSRQ